MARINRTVFDNTMKEFSVCDYSSFYSDVDDYMFESELNDFFENKSESTYNGLLKKEMSGSEIAIEIKSKLATAVFEDKQIEKHIPLLLSGVPFSIKQLFNQKYTNATNIPVFLKLKRTELLKEICNPTDIILTKYIISNCSPAAMKLFSYIIDNMDLYELTHWNALNLKITSKDAVFKTIKIGNLTHNTKHHQYTKKYYIPSTLYVDHSHMDKFNDSDRYLILCALMHIKEWYHFTEKRKKDKQNTVLDLLDSLYD